MADFEKIAFVASETRDAEDAYAALVKRYGNVPPKEADAIVALGGDGLMLQTMHDHLHSRIPIYVNTIDEIVGENRETLLDRVKAASLPVVAIGKIEDLEVAITKQPR